MSNLVQTEANNLLNGSLGVVGNAFVAPVTPMKLALDVGPTNNSGNGTATTAGTEASGGSYARQSVTFGVASGGSSTNTNVVNFLSMPAVGGSTWITGGEVYDSAGTPSRRWFGALSAQKQTSAGDTLSFAIGAIVVGLS